MMKIGSERQQHEREEFIDVYNIDTDQYATFLDLRLWCGDINFSG